MCSILLSLILLLLESYHAICNDTQWILGTVLKCKTLRRQKKESFLYLNERVSAMNNSYAMTMTHSVTARGQIKMEWLKDRKMRVAVKPKYLKPVSQFVVHHCVGTVNAFYVTSLWQQLASDRMQHVIVCMPLIRSTVPANTSDSTEFNENIIKIYVIII